MAKYLLTIVIPQFGTKKYISLLFCAATLILGVSFLNTGLSSFPKRNIFFVFPVQTEFIPQGLVMCVYGTIGIILGLFLILTFYWNIGSGYNIYCGREQNIKIYRSCFPTERKLTVHNYARLIRTSFQNYFLLEYPFRVISKLKFKYKPQVNKVSIIAQLANGRMIPILSHEATEKLMVLQLALILVNYVNLEVPLELTVDS
uniref:Photosystem I assembly protein Ycf4 n=1 Tax=Karenia mikimotoi TaxID=225107 RepID=A0A0U1V1Y5_KARMI|nr:photosystem I assembly protein Ycf4 [Karenia mikimotoi]